MTDDHAEIKDLLAAIVRRAIIDWRNLCEGGTERNDTNFKELENFFTSNFYYSICDVLDLDGESMYHLLRKERRKANCLQYTAPQ